MSTITEKQGSKREILRKEVGFPMAGRKKAIQGKLVRFELRLPEDIDGMLNLYLDGNPYTDKTKTIRQAIAEFLDRQPEESKQRKTA